LKIGQKFESIFLQEPMQIFVPFPYTLQAQGSQTSGRNWDSDF